jgi:ABC-type multidrug transport system ATPase subunit
MEEAIAVENMAKRFENVEAVSGISFTAGKVFYLFAYQAI